METISCPVCGETVEVEPDASCPSCGAMLTPELLEDTDRLPLAPESPAPDKKAASPPAEPESELDVAFRQQFEENKITLPKRWRDKLRKLATEVEVGRRVATLFFVDLRGYARMTQKMNEMQLDRLRHWFYELCTRRIELHGGFVIQFLGDATFAAFGAPWAFERDSESALLALLEIREEVRRKGNFEGHPLSIRAGVDAGPVIVQLTEEHGRPRPDLFGTAVNLAARLMEQAETWEILISENLAEQVKNLFDLESRGRFLPKNFEHEVEAFAVKSHKDELAGRRFDETRFIGRTTEALTVSTWISRARAGEFVKAFVVGDSGIGKSRLLQEVFRQFEGREPLQIKLDCEPHDRHILLGSILGVLRQMASRLADMSPAHPLSSAIVFQLLTTHLPGLDPATVANLGYAFGIEPHLSALRGLPSGVRRAQVVSALATVLRSTCKERTWALIVDDAQWADTLTWEVWNNIFDDPPSGMLLLFSGRLLPAAGAEPGHSLADDANVPEWNDSLLENAEFLSLGVLPEPERVALVAEIIDPSTLHPLVRKRILTDAEGIPLYILELAREAARQSAEGVVEITGPDYSGITPAVIGAVQARIDRLSAQRRSLLQCGAALGRRFSHKLIRIFEEIYEELQSELSALKGLRLLSERATPGDIEYVFTPSVVRDVAYQMLTPEQKLSLHRTIAEQLEIRFQSSLDAYSFELAVHWSKAGALNKARRYLKRAAQQAIDLGVPHDAYGLIQRALDLQASPAAGVDALPNDLLQIQQVGLLHELGGLACFMMGDLQKSDEHYRQMKRIAGRVNNPSWAATAACQLADNALDRGELEEAEKLMEEAFTGAHLIGAAARARIYNARGILRLRTGRLEGALADFRTVTDALGDQFSKTRADAWNNTGLIQWQKGALDEAADSYWRAMEYWERLGNPFGQVSSLSNLGIIAEKQGRFSEALEFFRRGIDLAEEIGYLHGISALEANIANLQLLRHEWNDARLSSARSLHAARAISHKHSEAIALENLGLALGGAGLVDEAIQALDQGARIARSSADPSRRDSAMLSQAWVAIQNGMTALAGEVLAQVAEDCSPDLVAWKETLELTLEAARSQDASRLSSTLDGFQQACNVEDYLRRLDALAILSDQQIAHADAEDLARRRDAIFRDAMVS